jgi:hypothetical protein
MASARTQAERETGQGGAKAVDHDDATDCQASPAAKATAKGPTSGFGRPLTICASCLRNSSNGEMAGNVQWNVAP